MRQARAVAVAVALVAVGALAVATRGLAPVRAGVLALELETLVFALAAVWIAARAVEEPPLRAELARWGPALGAYALGTVVACAARGAPGLMDALLAQLLVALTFASLLALSLAAGVRGPGAALLGGIAAAVLAFGAPWLAGEAVAALPREAEARAVSALVVASPPVAAAGTFGGADVLRSAVLYERFRPAQDVPFGYASPLAVIGAHALAAAGLAALAHLLRKRRALPVAAVLLLLAIPARADAQVFGGGEDVPPAEGEIGPMMTRVRLGYIVPFVDGRFRMTGVTPVPASEFKLQEDLDLRLTYAVPTFELELGWKGAGRVWAEYWEAAFQGDFLSPQPVEAAFRNIVIPATEVGLVDYRFRTVALRGAVDIPVLDWATLSIIGTTRYVHWFTKVRAPRNFLRDSANFDIIIPGIGVGFDIFVVDKVFVYGDATWLDYSLGGLFGRDEKGPEIKYREFHGGVRLELLETAHVGIEYYHLETTANDGRHDYSQEIIGPRIWVGVQF